ncbi:hypothetical protein PV10_08261 [Exophiala mesophila]|uniref:Uncharacterized protein n=1 Tax=Exophiala mesophila TaxID=212818 RepID=A0A0D1XK87_EXOME|nr:uncharacterized protein PV10_08261 [Exophiala mesophila]KIV88591.1 hypothetical protein PV10_08261 [Exophiala mesophila]
MAWGINHVITLVSAIAHLITNAPWAVRDASSWLIQSLMPPAYQRSLPATSSSATTFATAVLSAFSSSTTSLVPTASSVLRPFVTTVTATTTSTVTTTTTIGFSTFSPSSTPGFFDSNNMRMPPSEIVRLQVQPGLAYNGHILSQLEIFIIVASFMALLRVLLYLRERIAPSSSQEQQQEQGQGQQGLEEQQSEMFTAPVNCRFPTLPLPPVEESRLWLDRYFITCGQFFDRSSWTASSSTCVTWICWLFGFPLSVIFRLFIMIVYVSYLTIALSAGVAILHIEQFHANAPPAELLLDILFGTVVDPRQVFEESKWPKTRLALAVLRRQYPQSDLLDTRSQQNRFEVPYSPESSVQGTAAGAPSSRELELVQQLELADERARESLRESTCQLESKGKQIDRLQGQLNELRHQLHREMQDGETERLAVVSVRSQLAEAEKATKKERLGRKLAEEKHAAAQQKQSELEESFRLSLSAAQQQPQDDLKAIKAMLDEANARAEQVSSAAFAMQQELAAKSTELEQLKALASTATTSQQALTARGEEIEIIKRMAQKEISAKSKEIEKVKSQAQEEVLASKKEVEETTAKAAKVVTLQKAKIAKLEESLQKAKDQNLTALLAQEKAEVARLMALGTKVQEERDQARSAVEAREERLKKLELELENLKAADRARAQLASTVAKKAPGLEASRWATPQSAADQIRDTKMDLDGEDADTKSAGLFGATPIGLFGAKIQPFQPGSGFTVFDSKPQTKQQSQFSGFGSQQQGSQQQASQSSPFTGFGSQQQGSQPSAIGNNGFGSVSSFGRTGFGSNQPSALENSGFGGIPKSHQTSGFGNVGFGNAQQNSGAVVIPGLTLLDQSQQQGQVHSPDHNMTDQDAPAAQPAPSIFDMFRGSNNQGPPKQPASTQDAFRPATLQPFQHTLTLEGFGSNQNNAQSSGTSFMSPPAVTGFSVVDDTATPRYGRAGAMSWYQAYTARTVNDRAVEEKTQKAWDEGRQAPRASAADLERRAVRALPPPKTGLVVMPTPETPTNQVIGQGHLETASSHSPCYDQPDHSPKIASTGLQKPPKPQSAPTATETPSTSVPLSTLKDESGNVISPAFVPNATSFKTSPKHRKPVPPSVAATLDTPINLNRPSPPYRPSTSSSAGYAQLQSAQIPSSRYHPGAFKMKPSPLAQVINTQASKPRPASRLSNEQSDDETPSESDDDYESDQVSTTSAQEQDTEFENPTTPPKRVSPASSTATSQEGSNSDDDNDDDNNAVFEDIDLSLDNIPSTLTEVLSLEPISPERPHDLTKNEASSSETKPETETETGNDKNNSKNSKAHGHQRQHSKTRPAPSEASSPVSNKRTCQASSPSSDSPESPQSDASPQKRHAGQFRPMVTDPKIDATSYKGRDWAYIHHMAFLDDPEEFDGEGPFPHSKDLETQLPRTIYGCRDLKCVRKVVAHDCVLTLARRLGKEQEEEKEKGSLGTQTRAEATEVIDL